MSKLIWAEMKRYLISPHFLGTIFILIGLNSIQSTTGSEQRRNVRGVHTYFAAASVILRTQSEIFYGQSYRGSG